MLLQPIEIGDRIHATKENNLARKAIAMKVTAQGNFIIFEVNETSLSAEDTGSQAFHDGA